MHLLAAAAIFALASTAQAQTAAPAAEAAAPATPAPAAAAPAKPKKVAKAAAGLKVHVTNKRTSDVAVLAFVPQGSETEGANLLKKPLPAGKSLDLTVAAAKGQCMFDVQGNFADEVEISGSGLNLCKDKNVVLTD
jgi:hypothetical protein